jgi:hypothetical protein
VLAQLGASAAASASAASLSLLGMLGQSTRPTGEKFQPSVDFSLGQEPLQPDQVLRLSFVGSDAGLKLAETSVIGKGDQLPPVGLRADRSGLDLAVVREGDTLRVHGLNSVVGTSVESSRCIVF